MGMIDFTEIPHDSDKWELFSRDFLEELGFFIESPPNRGADGGKDLLITEDVKGKLHRYKFRWLVSCKHFSKSKKSVNENDDEKNILERVKSFKADGFIGFYSTIASSGLNLRLEKLRESKDIKDYKIFDGELIEKYLLRIGYSQLMQRYMPKSHKCIRPPHKMFREYAGIRCDCCGADLLEKIVERNGDGIVATCTKNIDDVDVYVDSYFACKGPCDDKLNSYLSERYNTHTGWEEIKDLTIPLNYIRYAMAIINNLSNPKIRFEKKVIEREKELLLALSQIVMRENSEEEKARVATLMSILG